MTNKEYLTIQLGKFGVTSEEIDLILVDNGINGEDQATDTKALKTAVFYKLPEMLAGMQDVSEGGYSVKWNLAGIKAWYSFLAGELGLPDKLTPAPTITGVKPW